MDKQRAQVRSEISSWHQLSNLSTTWILDRAVCTSVLSYVQRIQFFRSIYHNIFDTDDLKVIAASQEKRQANTDNCVADSKSTQWVAGIIAGSGQWVAGIIAGSGHLPIIKFGADLSQGGVFLEQRVQPSAKRTPKGSHKPCQPKFQPASVTALSL